MPNFNQAIGTNKAMSIITDILAGKDKVQFMHAVASSKDYSKLSNEQLASLETIDSVEQDVPIKEVNVLNNNTVAIPLRFDNTEVQTDFMIYTIGIYARELNGSEVLYSVMTAKTPQEQPAYDGISPTTFKMNAQTLVGKTANVETVVNPLDNVTQDQLTAYLKDYISMASLEDTLQSKNYASKDYVDQSIKDATPKLPDNLVSLSSDNTTVTATTKDGKQTGVWVTQETLDSLAKDTNVVHRNPDTGAVGETLDFTLSNIMASGHKFMVYDEAPDEETALAQSKANPGVFQIYTEE